MTDQTLNTCGEREHLIGYVYDELEPAARARVEEHLSSCADCRVELEGLREVRAHLATWQLPDEAGEGAGWKIDVPARRHASPWWAPSAVAAAAVILLAVAAAIANLEIMYGRDGISIRTGWNRTPASAQTTVAAAPSQPAERMSQQTVSTEDLAALEKRLRTEFHALAASTPRAAAAPAPSGNAVTNTQLLQRVQDLIDQSEARQRRELAMRVAQVVRDFDTQRQTDLVRIQQGLGQIEGSTAADRQLLNYLVRVSQRQK
jgi:hypothetical protein